MRQRLFVSWIRIAVLGSLIAAGLGCDDEECPWTEASTPMCAYGQPGNCCSDFIWPAICQKGQWVCPPGGGYSGGILVDQCRRVGCPFPGRNADAGTPDGPAGL